MEPFKNLLNPQTVRDTGRHLQRAWPDLDRARFERLASTGLEALELKSRARHMAAALQAVLPADFGRAADILEASLAPVQPADTGPKLPPTSAQGLSGWGIWPLTDYVATCGLASPERALQALHAMTQRFTAEWALRPFIEAHPQLCWATLSRWTADPSEHVRRLVSEGTRPRLPWGLQLKGLIADPSPTLPLLRALQDDASAYVRRSVANHLNDIAKDHPMRVADWLAEHLPGAPAPRQALLRHACRSLIKQGHPQVLALWGVGQAFQGTLHFSVQPDTLVLGENLALSVTLRSGSALRQSLVVDLAVHHVKANGSTSPKVFKGWTLQLEPGETRVLQKRHAVKPITTRRYYAGRHRVDLIVNGRVCGEAAFDLRLD